MFDANELRRLTSVRHAEVHDTLGSTNDRAVDLARDAQIELPALVVARLQTAGKGRGQHTWWAADGALTFSLLLDSASTGIAPANWPQVSLATAMAVCDALSALIDNAMHARFPTDVHLESLPRLAIKWPNDVLLDSGKVCGILIESPGGHALAKNRLIVGVGININNTWRNAPREAGTNGTAFCDATGTIHELQSVLIEVLTAFNLRINQLRRDDVELIHAWQRLNFFAGKRVTVESNGRMIEGQCEEIAYDGALVVKTPFGRQQVYSGSVRAARSC